MNTGIGVRPDHLQRIFDVFHQESTGAAHARGGLGLGLSLARGLTELHGGNLQAFSQGLGHGTEFVVRLPLSAITVAAPSPEREKTRPTGTLHILLVEDDVDAGEMLKRLLAARGHQVRWAHSGAQALQRIGEGAVDVVLCDIGLPDMDGHELVQRLRDHVDLRGRPVIALSGYGQAADRARALTNGFDGYVVKPVSIGGLEEAIEELILGFAGAHRGDADDSQPV